ncbi:hypothetical protein CCR75_000051 [Bremia lactucae]|uniref:Uncharacterized protein n=1 Tax=Bremia lactucae TaxID=4779 RepID=A0A976FHT2_BRELC|nr:hypothetical protein CCR75_000051 [Bremia lactucae]
MRNQVPGVRIKQTNNSGLEKVYQLATVKENMMKENTLRPTERQRTTPRPPLSRRPVIGRNRANSGVGIVRCRSWQLNAEDTETEDECAGSKDSPRTVVQLPAFGRAKVVKMRMATGDCGCSEVGKSCANENVDDPAGKSALSIDSSRLCFTRHMNEDSWQLHLFSPDALDEV